MVKYPAQFFGARTFGFLVIVVGLLTLALACWQHRKQMKRLRSQCIDAPTSMSLVVVSLIAALGLVASDQHQKNGHA